MEFAWLIVSSQWVTEVPSQAVLFDAPQIPAGMHPLYQIPPDSSGMEPESSGMSLDSTGLWQEGPVLVPVITDVYI